MTAELYMSRCFDLARLAAGKTAPNPMVGALLVHQNRIIGQGFHEKYGTAHAEVQAIDSVATEDRALIAKSTLYVSLEPCCIHGNTPPCTDLIIRHRIPKVVISCVDQTAGVSGKSLHLLRDAGCEVSVGVLKQEGQRLCAIRNTFVSKKRPYIILKYARSEDGFMGHHQKQLWLSNNYSRRLVHKWRSEASAILVGTNTALVDNPRLNNRFYFGPSPLRICFDRKNRLPDALYLKTEDYPTWILGTTPGFERIDGQRHYIQIAEDKPPMSQLLSRLYEKGYSSLLVEGGAQLLQSFIEARLWDEARILISPAIIGQGIPAPKIPDAQVSQRLRIAEDRLLVLFPKDKR